MSHPCARFQTWLEEDEELKPDALTQQARAEHLLECADCREEMKGVVVQSATVRGVFQRDGLEPPLPEALVARCVEAMQRASSSQADGAQSAG